MRPQPKVAGARWSFHLAIVAIAVLALQRGDVADVSSRGTQADAAVMGPIAGSKASSSSSPACGHDASPPEKSAKATLAPQRNVVHVDEDESAAFMLTHHETGERVTLEQGIDWTLAFDEDGYGFLYDSQAGDPQPIRVEERLKFNIYIVGCRRMMLWRPALGGGAGVTAWLEESKTQYGETTLSFSVGATLCEVPLTMLVLKFPRKSSKLFVALKDLYTGMSLSQFNGRSWMWIFGSYRRWWLSIEEHGLGEHTPGSAQSRESIESNEFGWRSN